MGGCALGGRAPGRRVAAVRARRRHMTSLVWARPEALWLLALVPLIVLSGYLWGVRSRRLQPAPLLLRSAVVALLAIALAEPLLAAGTGMGGAVFVIDHSASVAPDARDTANRWFDDALAAAPA